MRFGPSCDSDRMCDCSSTARAQYIYVCMIYTRMGFLRGTRFGKATMLHSRAKILLGAVQPNLVSVVSQGISRGVISAWINRCFLHFTGQQEMFGPGKGINHHHKRRFSSPCHCVYVQNIFFLTHPVLQQSKYKHRIRTWKVLWLAAANDSPFLPLPTTVLPSWVRAQRAQVDR